MSPSRAGAALLFGLAICGSALPRAAQFDPEEVIFYSTYGFRQGATWVIPLRAKVQEPPVPAVFTALFAALPARGTEEAARFRTRIADFVADDESGESVRIRFDRDPNDVDVRITDGRGGFPDTDDDGVVEGVVTIPLEVAELLRDRQASPGGWLSFRASSNGHRGTGRVRLLEPTGASVVSDVDDTVKVTEIPAGAATVALNTFYRPFVAAAELASRYRAPDAAYHYVSGGPWQMYRPVSAFLTGDARYPEGSYHMRRIGGSITRPVTSLQALSDALMAGGTFEHKVSTITTLMERFPARAFVRIGDSGEQDPEVYRAIASRFPAQVREIVIRDVVNARVRDPKRLAGMTVVPAPTVDPR